MEKIFCFFIFATLGAQVFSVNPRLKRQDGDKLQDKYGWYLLLGGDDDPALNPTESNQTQPPVSKDVNDQIQADCIKSCPVTSEYNPVCGSNNETYTNHGRLICAQSCGVNVTLARTSRCPATTPEPSTSEST